MLQHRTGSARSHLASPVRAAVWGTTSAPLRAIAALLFTAALLAGASMALAAWTSTGSGVTGVSAVSTGSGNSPTVTVSGRTVQLSWPDSMFSSGESHSGYVITRYESTGTAEQAMSSGTCLGVAATSPCTETAVPPGTWKYTVTPAAGSWRGTESTQVTAVVAQPVLTLTPTLTTSPTTLTGTISSFIAGETLRFRLDNATSGTILSGTVDGASTPAAVPASGSASVTVALPSATTNGPHVVYAVTTSGDNDGANVTVDNTAPAPPTLTATPGKQTAALTATFSFTDTSAVASYQCKLDAGAYTTCTSPTTYTGLAEGRHDFSVIALNTLGTASAPTTYDWKVNSTPPTASITFSAAGTSTTSASYASGCGTPATGDFCGTASQGPGPNPLVSVQVSVQRASTGLYWNGTSFASAGETFLAVATSNGWADWTFAFPIANFPADGSYTISANSTNSVGNTGPTSTATFTLDNSAPAVTTITSSPPAASASSTGQFSLSHPEPGVLLQCKLDAGAYTNCTSPTTYSGLAEGAHTFRVRAVDAAGNVGPETTHSWSVDTVAPVSPAFTSGPTGPTTATTASFGFTDAEPGVVFACSIDGGSYSACTSPTSYSGLSDGAHVVQVTAADAVGNVSIPVSRSWTVDTTGPTVAVTFPDAGSSYTDTGFAAGCTGTTSDICGTASDATTSVATVKVSIQQGSTGQYWNGSSFASATAVLFTASGTTTWNHPFAATNFPAEGSYTVRALGTDAVGNATTITTAFTVDRTAPVAPTISSGPATPTKVTTASIAFSHTEPGVAFSCQLEGGGFTSCTSPKAYAGLTNGSHTFQVRVTDAAGNVSAAASHTWTVDTAAPTAAVTFPVNGVTYGTSGYTAGCSSPATGDICGTSADTGGTGVTSVQVSLRRVSGGLYWNGTSFASAAEVLLAATGTTSWSYGIAAATFPADGAYTVRTVATDAATNTVSATATFTLDRTAPATPVITSQPTNLTSSTTAAFSFTAEAGAMLSCSLDGGAATTCSSPRSYTGLGQGVHTFAVTATDALGNTSAAATDSWTVDLTGPSSTFTFPASSGSYNTAGWNAGCGTAATGDLCGTSADTGGAAVSSVQVSLQRASTLLWWNGSTFSSASEVLFTATGTTSWSYPFAAANFVSEGAYTVRVRSTDTVGNVGSVFFVPITIDRTAPPTPTVTSAPPSLTNATTASLSFTDTEAGVTFQCQLDGGGFTTCTSPKSYAGLGDGSHTFQVRATDAAGNTSAATSAAWTVDTVPPPVPTITTGPAAQTTATTASLAFTDTEPGVTFLCSLNGSVAAACTSPKAYTGLTDGTQTFTVAARDAAGNVSAVATRTWLVDRTGPVSALTSPAPGGSYNDTAYNAGCVTRDICGTADDGTGSGVSSVVLSIQAPSGKWWNNSNGFNATSESFWAATGTTSWSYTLPIADIVDSGTYTIRVRATDPLGNVGAFTTTTFTIDRVAPASPTITASPANPSPSTAPSFSFTGGEATGTYQCQLDAGAWTTCTSPRVYSGVADGSHTFRVRSVDAATNASPAVTHTWTVDATAPVVAITFPVAGVEYNAAGYLAGCGTAATGDMCGTASDATSGLSTVRVSLRNVDSGLYWNGTSFAAAAEVLLTPAGTTSWVLAFVSGNFPEATFTLRAVATDAAGNTASASRTFDSDTLAPPTPSITSNPPAATSSTSASFAFTDTEAGVIFRCKLDGGAYGDCTSPTSYTGLADGSHTFSVTATDSSDNTSAAATYTWTVQTVAPPAPTITAGPAAATTSTSASLSFTDSQSGVTFRCQLDGGGYTACTSPKAYTGLSEGSHTFMVTAVDASGNVSAPTSRTWVVDSIAPSTSGIFPGNGERYGTTTFNAGCGTAGTGDMCGTTSDSGSGVASVSISLQQTGAKWWDGGTFNSASELFYTPTGTTSWSWPFSATPLQDGVQYTLKVIVTDNAGLQTTATSTFTMDKTGPSGVDVQAPARGVVGKAEIGDTMVYTFSESTLDPTSILNGWNGTSTNVVVRMNNGSPDNVTIWNAANSSQLPLGTVALSADTYVTANVTFGATGTASTMVLSGSTVTVTLGTVSSTASVGTSLTNGDMTWTPSNLLRDLAGNAMATTPAVESGNDPEY